MLPGRHQASGRPVTSGRPVGPGPGWQTAPGRPEAAWGSFRAWPGESRAITGASHQRTASLAGELRLTDRHRRV